MRWILRLVVILLVGLPLALAAVALLAVEDTPLVSARVVFTPASIERAKRLLARNDPRRMRPGVLRTIAISQEDLDLSANYLASRYARGSASVALREGAATLRATMELAPNPVGRYLNLQAVLTDTPGLPRVEQLRIGRVPVPSFVCNWLLRAGIMRLQSSDDYSGAADLVKQVISSEGMLKVVFEWSDAAARQLKAVLVPPDEQARWQAYQGLLVGLTSGSGRGRPVNLEGLLLPMLQLAAQRSENGRAAAENRALLIVLAFYVNGKGLAALVPQARGWPAPTQRVVTLAGRADFPQHFTISAALAATAGSPLSDAVGLYKEVEDSRGGSGFSFNDIAADRAGTRFGEKAVASDAAAAKLQQRASRGLHASDLLPETRDLPEYLSEAEFKRRFGGIGQPAYSKMLTEIERRLAAMPLYR